MHDVAAAEASCSAAVGAGAGTGTTLTARRIESPALRRQSVVFTSIQLSRVLFITNSLTELSQLRPPGPSSAI